MSVTAYSTSGQRLQAHQQVVVHTPEAIASYCGRPERNGNDWKCNCPICGKHSLTIARGFKFQILIQCWYCRDACGHDGFTEQRAYLADAGLLDPDEHPAKFDREAYERRNAKRRSHALALWGHPFIEPVTPGRTAAKYLEARGLGAFVGHSALRCTPCELIARVWHVQHGLSAVQYTVLLFDGSDRDRAEGRRTIGVLKGAGVWLGNPRPDEWCVVGEGLETVLSAMLLLKQRCGVACLGTNFKDLVFPKNVRKILFAVDNDEKGRDTAAYASKVWRQQGLIVRSAMPTKEGDDFNDVLRREQGLRFREDVQ